MTKQNNNSIQLYKELFSRYLNQLTEEITSFKNESDIWELKGNINNAPGTLCVHLCGNLQHFIGAVIAKTGYVRQREHEFEVKHVPREELLSQVEVTRQIVEATFESLTDDELDKIYPANHFGENITYSYALTRLVTHFAYHVGQINYYRRAINNN
jgi:hypothetical protein